MNTGANAPETGPDRATDTAVVAELLTRFIADETHKAGFQRLVVGMSGGLDSSLAAALAARAVGPAEVRGVLMPCGLLSRQATEDASLVAAWIGVETETVEIGELVDRFFGDDRDASRLRRGNVMARVRMTVLYDRSMRDGALVVGTSNKSELLLGYGTVHGDLASAINPIGDLYKTQVRELARALDLPARILDKPPSADLWPGQSDEQELGFSYAQVDRVLYLLVDRRLRESEVVDLGFDAGFVRGVAQRIRSTQFKRRLPLIAKVSDRTVGIDFRYPRDWGS